MKDTILKLYAKFQNQLSSEEGQDLVEYALLVALIALGATAAMNSLSTAISGAFNNVATQLNGAV